VGAASCGALLCGRLEWGEWVGGRVGGWVGCITGSWQRQIAAYRVHLLTWSVPLCLPAHHAPVPAAPVHEKLLSLFQKGGYEVVYPKGLSSRWAAGPGLDGWVGGRRHWRQHLTHSCLRCVFISPFLLLLLGSLSSLFFPS
jgi:hypothetical protein